MLSDAHEGRSHSVAKAIAEDHGVETLGVHCDVRDKKEVESLMAQALERFGRIDGLMNNAGINVLAKVVDMTDEQWSLVIDIANAALFLMSVEGSYLTGQTLSLSGGSVMLPQP